MNDRQIMEGILLTTKGVCDLYMHGAIESATPNVHQTFNTALNDAINMQSGIYQQSSRHIVRRRRRAFSVRIILSCAACRGRSSLDFSR